MHTKRVWVLTTTAVLLLSAVVFAIIISQKPKTQQKLLPPDSLLYVFDWRADTINMVPNGLRFKNQNYDITVTDFMLSTYSVVLTPCYNQTLGFAPIALAGHGVSNNGNTRIGASVIERDVFDKVIKTTRPDTALDSFCGLHYLTSVPADAPVLSVTGMAINDAGQIFDFAYASNTSRGKLYDFTSLQKKHLLGATPQITMQRNIADWFNEVNFSDTETDWGAVVQRNMLNNITIEVQ